MSDLEPRVKALEKWQAEQITHQAVSETERRHLDKRFDSVEDGLRSVNGHINKLVWIVFTAIILTVLGVLFKGSGL